MGNDNVRGRQRGKKFVWFERMLRREGRKLCAVALCASLIVGNMAWPAAAAGDTSGEYSFELTSESLFNAIQDAIADGTVVDTDLDLKGSAAEEYQELLEAGGNLYEIEPVIENTDSDRDKVLDLRAFVRLENDIELDSAYVMDGSEEITFLLINSSDVYQEATICVDGRESETITVLPASAVAVDEEEAGPGVTGTANNTSSTVTGSGSISSSGGGSGGGGSSTDSTEENTEESTAESNTTDADTDTDLVEITIQNEGADNDDDSDEDSIVEVQVNNSQDPEEEETSGTVEEESKADVESETGTDGAPVTDDSSEETDDEEEVTDSTPVEEADGGSDPEEEPEDDGTTEDSGTVEEEAAGADTTGEEGGTGTKGSDTEESENGESGGGQDEGTNDNTEDDEQDNTNDNTEVEVTVSSAISLHTTYRVAASATASDAEKATSSDAAGLNGQAYETVLVSGKAAVAFVAETEELGLDKIESIAYTAELDDVVISVEVPVGALPWGVELKASEYEKDSETYLSRYEEAVDIIDEWDAEDDYTQAVRLFDIGFYGIDGEEVEPGAGVSVRITYLEDTENSVSQVIHFGDEETEIIDVESTYNEDGKNIEFELESFSEVMTIEEGPPGEGPGGGEEPGGQTTVSGYYHIDLRVTSTISITVSNTTTGQTDVTVNKVWESDEEDNRPSDITVYLMDSNGVALTDSEGNYLYSATLTADNNWSYTWENVSLSDGTYSVGEEIVTGYSMESATTFTVDSTGSSSDSSTSETYKGTITVISISSLTLTHDGEDYEVEMNAGSTPDENDEDEYEFTSVAGHSSTEGGTPEDTPDQIVEMEDGDTLTVEVTYSYTYADSSGKEYSDTVTTTIIHTVNKESNFCEGKENTNQYGYDFRITAEQLLEEENIITDDQVVTITNKPSTASITITKIVTGNMGDTTKEFSFTLTDSEGNDLTGTEGFTLSSGDNITFDGIAIGSTIILTEDSDGYTASAECTGGTLTKNSDGSYSIVVTGSDDVTITVTNNKETDVDNGIFLDSLPYLLLLSLAVIPSAFLLFRRRSQWF